MVEVTSSESTIPTLRRIGTNNRPHSIDGRTSSSAGELLIRRHAVPLRSGSPWDIQYRSVPVRASEAKLAIANLWPPGIVLARIGPERGQNDASCKGGTCNLVSRLTALTRGFKGLRYYRWHRVSKFFKNEARNQQQLDEILPELLGR